MAVTIVDADLLALLDRDTGTFTVFKSQALTIVNENLTASGLSEAIRSLIATYIAAHLVVLSEGGELVRRQTGDTEEEFQQHSLRSNKNGLASTRFGAMAVDLDTTGTLVSMSTNTGNALFRVV